MKVQEKREKKIRMILDAALNVWSKEEFQNTSLSLLASNLGITKQALYRYFKNKEELIESINQHIQKICIEENESLFYKLQKLPYEKRMGEFIRIHSEYNRKHKNFHIFDSYWLMKHGEIPQRILDSQRNGITKLLRIETREFYLISFLNLIFWGWGSKHHIKESRSFEERYSIMMELINNGLGTDSFRPPLSTINVKDLPQFKDFSKLIKSDKIFYSITQSIKEQGINGVTLENIAARAGLSKSSLYNYFQNRDDMLTSTLNRLVSEYINVHTVLLSKFDSFEEKLIAHLELQLAVLPVKPQSIMLFKKFLHKDVLQRISPPLSNPDFLSFIQDGIGQKKLKNLLAPREYQIIFSSFIYIEKYILWNGHRNDKTQWLQYWLRIIRSGILNKEK